LAPTWKAVMAAAVMAATNTAERGSLLAGFNS